MADRRRPGATAIGVSARRPSPCPRRRGRPVRRLIQGRPQIALRSALVELRKLASVAQRLRDLGFFGSPRWAIFHKTKVDVRSWPEGALGAGQHERGQGTSSPTPHTHNSMTQSPPADSSATYRLPTGRLPQEPEEVLRDEIEAFRKATPEERSRWLAMACRSAARLGRSREQAGLLAPAAEPWPPSTWEFLHTHARRHAAT